MNPAFASMASRLQPRLDEISARLGMLEEALAKGGMIGEYRELLRSDLQAVMNLLGHTGQRVDDRELSAFAMAEWTLTRSLSLPSKLESLAIRGDWVADQFLAEELVKQRKGLREADNGKCLGIPAFLDGIEGDARLAQWASELAKAVYAVFTWIVRLDGAIQPDEAAGFKVFWEQYRPLQEKAAAPIGSDTSRTTPPPRPLPAAPEKSLPKFVPQAWGMKDAPSLPTMPPRPSRETPATEPAPGTTDFVLPKSVMPSVPPAIDLADALAELDGLTGLDPVKAEVKSLANLLRIQAMRRERGMAAVPVSLHTVFTGNPGTGKTSVARLYARILRGLGILSKGHLVETDRSGLVAGYMGQTAEKVDAVVQSALDGVLFIDEAYSLVGDDSSDYGHEAVSTLLARIENHRDRLVVVAAGYGDEMDKFLDANPGLRSRFPRKWHFPDYSGEEMAQIFERLCAKNGMHLQPEAREKVATLAREALDQNDPQLGNARYVRNLFESCIARQADRLAVMQNLSDQDLSTLVAADLPGRD